MDDLERKILQQIQNDIPLEKHPFQRLAQEAGIDEHRYLATLRQLVDSGKLRYIKPVISAKALGYTSVLIGAQVNQDRLEKIAAVVSSYNEVTHNYARSGEMNLWFTFTAETHEQKNAFLSRIRALDGVIKVLEFPSIKTYKIGLKLDV